MHIGNLFYYLFFWITPVKCSEFFIYFGALLDLPQFFVVCFVAVLGMNK